MKRYSHFLEILRRYPHLIYYLPTFDEKRCYNHFRNTYKAKHRNKRFDFPSWMKLLHEPTSCFNQEPPKYQEIANIIKKMKASSSPCPFDQISVLVLKKCPIVRTYVWKLLEHCWEKSDTGALEKRPYCPSLQERTGG